MKQNLLVDLLVIWPCERLVARQTHVSDNAEGPHVSPIITLVNLDDLWRHILCTTQAEGLVLFMVQKLGEAEITQFYLFTFALIFVNHNVFKLQVPMRNADSMHIIQGQHNLVDVISDLSLCQRCGVIRKSIQHVVALNVLHYNIDVAIVLHQVERAHNMRVVELPANFEFLSHEVHQNFVIGNAELIDNLDRDRGLPHTVLSLEDQPELTRIELLFELIDLANIVNALKISHVYKGNGLFYTQSYLGIRLV